MIDASAIVAILTNEEDADALADAVDALHQRITSPVAVFEAVLGICRKRHSSVGEGQHDVAEFLAAAGIRVVPLTELEGQSALDAFARYGKGTGHPAQLNMGDCFAYAVAKTARTPLLFKGDDFTRTDIPAVAIPRP